MSLTRLIYVSELNPSATLDIDLLLRQARTRNKARRVTGFLFFDGFYFVQALEGERTCVSETYHRIVQDARHRNLILIACVEIRARLFAGWSMGLHEGASFTTREAIMNTFSLRGLNAADTTLEDVTFLLQNLAIKLQSQEISRLKE